MQENRDERKELIKKDFDLLIGNGNLGFYKSCDIISIFLLDKEENKIKNFYTIIVFEEEELNSAKEKDYITKKPKEINERYSLGIMRKQKSIRELEDNFKLLLNENRWIDDGKDLTIGNLKALPKQFIPKNGTNNVALNSILKNNFYNGSYIVEFFDEEKKELKEVMESDKLLDKICTYIRQLLPIDLLFIRDRIGNILFQFPSSLITLDTRSLNLWEGIEAQVAYHPLLKDVDKISIQSSSNFDDNIMGFYQTEEIRSQSNKLYTGNSNGMNDTIIFNKEKGLILSCFSASFMKSVNIFGQMSMAHAEPRIIKFYDNKGSLEKTERIPLRYKAMNNTTHETDYSDWISNRIYENEKRNLSKNLILVQYGKNNKDKDKNRVQALNDLRRLINKYGRGGVYLWDPYLSYKDIFDTLYYCEVAGVPMKAINSFKRIKAHLESTEKAKIKGKYKEWLQSQKQGFENGGNHLGIDFQLRCQYGGYGWPFHDRFLIFPLKDGRPRAWSLGTSINSFGMEHHILQEVSNAKIILDAFIELWNELEDSQCLVWRSK